VKGRTSALQTETPKSFAVRDSSGALIIRAQDVAAGLGISIDTFMASLRAGIVYQSVERGVDEDAGRLRLTFRYRNRQYRVHLDETGQRIEQVESGQ
jgi:Family of unknown function (DUF6522)